MLFTSPEFPLFLAVVLGVYYVLSLRAQNIWLLVASYVFYGAWDWRFLGLIAFSTCVDYAIGRLLGGARSERDRKRILAASVVVNLGILGIFKYYNFFIDSAAALLEALGIPVHMPTLRVLLPVGVSFYTFQSLSYTIDVYRRRLEPERKLLTFALFVAYFPQLVAGPIERATHLLPVLRAPRRVAWPDIGVGAELILIGLFKKIAVADTLAPLVDARYASPEAMSGADLLLATYLFSFQIYCDFSGYSDIARGVSRLFGIKLIRNFEQPYLSQSITEFWRRWHISLSTWLRDYLYVSLGGNRKGRVRTYANLVATMLLGGLWHGANWTYIVWGGLHGVYLAVHKWWMGRHGLRQPQPHPTFAGRVIWALVTFHLVAFAWIFFRAADFQDAMAVISGIATWQPVGSVAPIDWLSPRLLALLGALLAIDVWQARRGDHAFMLRWPLATQAGGYASLVLLILVLGNLDDALPFIYFQF